MARLADAAQQPRRDDDDDDLQWRKDQYARKEGDRVNVNVGAAGKMETETIGQERQDSEGATEQPRHQVAVERIARTSVDRETEPQDQDDCHVELNRAWDLHGNAPQFYYKSRARIGEKQKNPAGRRRQGVMRRPR